MLLSLNDLNLHHISFNFEIVNMKKISILWVLVVLIGTSVSAQSKKWTLEECVDYAIKNNISIKQSELDLKVSDIEKIEALGSFMPTLNGNASFSVNTGASINPVTNQFQNETFKSFSAGLNSSVTIFNGLVNWKNLFTNLV